MPANHRGPSLLYVFSLNWSAEGHCGSEGSPGDPFTALPREYKRPTCSDLRNVEDMPSLEEHSSATDGTFPSSVFVRYEL